MVTEEQKKIFSDFLNNTFNETIKSNEETYKKTSQWIKNVYYKCIHDTLPEEHKEALERRLKRRKITMEDFLETKGNIDAIQELSKLRKTEKKEETKEVVAPIEEIKPIEIEDKTPKEEIQDEKEIKIQKIIETAVDETKPNKKNTDKTVETKEELLKKLEELDKKYFEIDDKIRSKQKRVFNHITDEEYENKKNELNEIKKQRLEVNRKLDAIKVEEEKPIKEKEAVTKKFEELVNQSKEKDKEISELKNEISKYKEERAYYNNKYKEEAKRELEIQVKELEAKYDEKLKNDVEQQIKKNTKKDEENKIIQKKHIINLLLTENIVSLDDIKFKLKTINCPTTKLDIALNEVMNEIPGVMKVLNSDGQIEYYSLCSSAVNKLEALKKIEVCPKLTNVTTGLVRFVAFADFHIPLDSKSDDIKKAIHPIFEYSSANKNLAVIDLGDDADTLKDIEYSRWQKQDKEAAKQAYDFFKKFGKVVSECPSTKLFYKPGNHEEHSYLVGIDPIEVLNSCTNNIVFLGSGKSSVMIGTEKLGIFHGIDSVPYGERQKFSDYSQHICEEIAKRLQQLAKDYFYTILAHYHFSEHRPFDHFSIIGHSVKCPVVFTAVLEDGQIKKMYAQNLSLSKSQNTYIEDPYRILVYDCNYKIKRIGHY